MRSRRGQKFLVLTPKSYFRGPELVPEKRLQQHQLAIQSGEESYGLASIFHTCNKQHAVLLILKGGSPVGPAPSSGSSVGAGASFRGGGGGGRSSSSAGASSRGGGGGGGRSSTSNSSSRGSVVVVVVVVAPWRWW